MTDWKYPIHPGEILAGELEEIKMKPWSLPGALACPITGFTRSWRESAA